MADAARSDAPTLTAAPAASPRRRASRVPLSLWLAVVLALVALVSFLVLTKGAGGVQVAVAARPLVAGEPVRPADYRFSVVQASASVTRNLFTPADVAALDGRPAAHAIPAGALIGRADVTEANAAPQPRAMSVPLDQTRAVGGALARGDTVDVIDSSGPQSAYVVTGARVLSVGETSGGGKFGGGSGHYAVTIAVDDAAALRVAAAITGGKVDVVRSTGAAAVVTPLSPLSPTTTAVKR